MSREALESTGRSVDEVGGEPKLQEMEGQPGSEREWQQGLGTQEGGCISNDLLKQSLNVVPRGLWVLIFGSVQ